MSAILSRFAWIRDSLPDTRGDLSYSSEALLYRYIKVADRDTVLKQLVPLRMAEALLWGPHLWLCTSDWREGQQGRSCRTSAIGRDTSSCAAQVGEKVNKVDPFECLKLEGMLQAGRLSLCMA